MLFFLTQKVLFFELDNYMFVKRICMWKGSTMVTIIQWLNYHGRWKFSQNMRCHVRGGLNEDWLSHSDPRCFYQTHSYNLITLMFHRSKLKEMSIHQGSCHYDPNSSTRSLFISLPGPIFFAQSSLHFKPRPSTPPPPPPFDLPTPKYTRTYICLSLFIFPLVGHTQFLAQILSSMLCMWLCLNRTSWSVPCASKWLQPAYGMRFYIWHFS